MDFPISGADEFAVLYWNDSEWIEVSQSLGEDKIAEAVIADTENEFYQIQSSGDAFFKILTTEKTGVLVLVKK